MRIIAKRTLREFWDQHPDAEQPLLDWHDQVIALVWQTPNHVKQTYGNASIIDANRVVFNIKGNDYRLITHIDYSFGIVFILWVGKHSDYDRIDARVIEFKRQNEPMSKVIRTETQYDDALERVYKLMQQHPDVNSPEGDELDVLVTLVEAYEAVHYPMAASDPVAYLKQRMAQMGLKQHDLVPFIGDKTQVSKVLNHKRDLTLPMIKRLSRGLNIPIQRLTGI